MYVVDMQDRNYHMVMLYACLYDNCVGYLQVDSDWVPHNSTVEKSRSSSLSKPTTHLMAITQVKLHQPATLVKNWRILFLVQS